MAPEDIANRAPRRRDRDAFDTLQVLCVKVRIVQDQPLGNGATDPQARRKVDVMRAGAGSPK